MLCYRKDGILFELVARYQQDNRHRDIALLFNFVAWTKKSHFPIRNIYGDYAQKMFLQFIEYYEDLATILKKRFDKQRTNDAAMASDCRAVGSFLGKKIIPEI